MNPGESDSFCAKEEQNRSLGCCLGALLVSWITKTSHIDKEGEEAAACYGIFHEKPF